MDHWQALSILMIPFIALAIGFLKARFAPSLYDIMFGPNK
jgi:hypothetical protein